MRTKHVWAKHSLEVKAASLSESTTSLKLGMKKSDVRSQKAGPKVSQARVKQLDELVVDWVASELHPFSIVSDDKFRRLMAVAVPGYDVPSQTRVQKFPSKSYKFVLDKLWILLDKEVEYMSLTTNAWMLKRTRSYSTLTIHFIN